MPHPVVLVLWIQQGFKMNTFTFYVIVMKITLENYEIMKLPIPISLAFGCVGLDSWLDEDEYGT